MYDVIVYGPLFCDLIFTDLPEMPTLGTEIFAGDFTLTIGGSAIVAAGLQKLGVKVGLAADLGNDTLSRLMGQILDDLNIDQTLIRKHPYPLTQLTVALSFPEDRSFITRLQRPENPAQLSDILAAHPARHVHLGSFLALFDAPDACQVAHQMGTTVSLDPGWDEDALHDPRLLSVLPELDYFLPSQSELSYMMNTTDTVQALEKASKYLTHGTIVMKDGANGAWARSRILNEHAPSIDVKPVDTTGAGDAFDAGFLYGITQGHTINESMRYGAICGALTITNIGGATGTPTLDEVKKWL
jgi:sugar/nucleoside kinase (ribokinase family)